jgi:hypothetical protein
MGILDWIKTGQNQNGRDANGPSFKEPSADQMPLRFEKPFAHMYGVMSPAERKTVDAIEERWRSQYERFRHYPPMSEGQVHERTVFNAIDGVHRALDARETAPVEAWRSTEVKVDEAFRNVREAFKDQRQFVEHEMKDCWER